MLNIIPTTVELAAPSEGTRAACEFAASQFQKHLTLADLAVAARLPASTLSRYFHKVYGTSPMRWLWAFRTLLAAELIAIHPSWSLLAISQECGFTSQAHFSRRFHALFGETPRSFREHFVSGGSGICGVPHPQIAIVPPEQRACLIDATLAKMTTKPLHCRP